MGVENSARTFAFCPAEFVESLRISHLDVFCGARALPALALLLRYGTACSRDADGTIGTDGHLISNSNPSYLVW